MTYAVTLLRIMLRMMKQVAIDLTPADATMLRKPNSRTGGFQSLLRKLQRQLEDRQLDVSTADVERLSGIRPRTAAAASNVAPRA